MGEARQVMDEVTEAAFSGDATRFGDCYADDATAMTPTQASAAHIHHRGQLGRSARRTRRKPGRNRAPTRTCWRRPRSGLASWREIMGTVVAGANTAMLREPLRRRPA